MIKIEEKTSIKCPGMTSLFISFNYNKYIIDIIKSCDGKQWDNKNKIWEVPLLSLSSLIDSLCEFDDIELHLLAAKPIKFKTYELGEYKLKPFEYQEEGIQYGLNHNKWLLLDEPGLGKTAQILHIAEELYNQGKIKHCLIICGLNTLKANWKLEVKKHTNLDCVVLGEKINSKGKIRVGSIDDRLNQLKHPIKEFFVITNVETLRDDRIIKALNSIKINSFDMIVADEIHKFTPSSQQGSNFLKLKNGKYKIGATGTLLLNSPLDAYVPLKFIEAENDCFSTFKNYYCKFNNDKNGIIVGFKNLALLKYEIEQNSLRRKKDLLKLPPKTIVKEYVEMDDRQATFYDNIKQGIIDEVDKVKISTTNLLSMISRLRQATSLPSILTSENINSAKIDRICDLTEQLMSNNEKVVIFSTFKEPIYELAKRLSKYNPSINTGDVKDDVISNNIEEFQTNPEAKIFLGTWEKVGTGITLTAASNLIFESCPWTAAAKQQAEDRIFRIGTTKNVFIYDIITKDTIDEQVDEIVQRKSAISDYIVDDKITEDGLKSLRKYIEELR